VNVGYELLVGLVLGFSLTIPPGPMNAYIAAQSVRSLRRGIVSGLGAMSADAVLAVLVYLFSSALDLHAAVRGIYAIGCVVMAFFAVGVLRTRPSTTLPDVRDARTYSTALGLGVSNPFQILWWLTAGLAFAYLGGAVLFIGLFGAIATWIVVFPVAFHLGIRRWPAAERWVTLVSGAILLVFAAYFAVLAI
jgi:threonine/homoserine/homoserine lactone efflux protein